MAMTSVVKDELSRVRCSSPAAARPRYPRCCGSPAACTCRAARIVIEAELDTGAAARRLRKDMTEVFGHPSELIVLAPAACARATATWSGCARTARAWPGRPA